MKSARKILVTLKQPELLRRSRKVHVTPDSDGQLPPRLVNPIDRRGRVIRGEWAEPAQESDAEGVFYRWAGASAVGSSNEEVPTP
ncbi:MAG: hypothetical protein JWM23_596 [Microbacteriaceae bacterium]|jgi:hypothetical protein|nr:hypothetical protein [Microbacteriaceae bacterium]